MPDINSLTSEVQRLSQDADSWATIVTWLLALTAVIGVVYFLATVRQSQVSKQLSDAQARLIKAKDLQLKSDLGAKGVEIALAQAAAAEADRQAGLAKQGAAIANERAGTANQEAARANERASKNEKDAEELRKESAELRKEAARLNKLPKMSGWRE